MNSLKLSRDMVCQINIASYDSGLSLDIKACPYVSNSPLDTIWAKIKRDTNLSLYGITNIVVSDNMYEIFFDSDENLVKFTITHL